MSKEPNRQVHHGECASLWAAIESIALKVDCVPKTLIEWGHKQELDRKIKLEGLLPAGHPSD